MIASSSADDAMPVSSDGTDEGGVMVIMLPLLLLLCSEEKWDFKSLAMERGMRNEEWKLDNQHQSC